MEDDSSNAAALIFIPGDCFVILPRKSSLISSKEFAVIICQPLPRS